MIVRVVSGYCVVALSLWVFACDDAGTNGGQGFGGSPANMASGVASMVSPVGTQSPAASNPVGAAGPAADPANMVGTSEPPSGPLGSMMAGMQSTGMPVGGGAMAGAMQSTGMPVGNGGQAMPAADASMAGGMNMAMAGAAGAAAPGGAGGQDADAPDTMQPADPMMGDTAGDTAAGALGGALMFTGEFTSTAGSVIDAKYKCPMPFGGGSGDNVSPKLEWSGGPAETMSFALVLYDSGYQMLHWAVWDIPATATSLPEGLPSGYELADPAGAHQAAAMGSDPHAYAGPCSAGAVAQGATYEFRLFALGAATLDLTEASSAAEAQAAIEAAALEKVVWTGNTE